METSSFQLHDQPSHAAPNHAAYVGSIPTNYHAGVGPVLFEPYAEELAKRVAARAPRRVLEVACGTGILTRSLRRALPPDTQLVATDLNEPMIAVARQTVGAAENLEWAQADMTRLGFSENWFDVVVCQFGLMFVPDKALALRELGRVLEPGGQLFSATWRALEHNLVLQLAHETVSALFPREKPQFYLVQTGFGEAPVMKRLMAEAGFGEVRASPAQMKSQAADFRALAVGLIRGFPIADFIAERDPALVGVAIEALAALLEQRFGPAPAALSIEALLCEAQKLAPS